MALRTDLLIASPTLQDALIDDATGLPLAAGVVTMYHDDARTSLKAWYYQSGTAGAYTYIPLPNPMILSSVGTIVDNNGNDTIPFFYPVVVESDGTVAADPYYVTVDNANGQRQFTRQNFPFVPPGAPPGPSVPTLVNYVVNGIFANNVGSLTTSAASTPASTYVINSTTFYYWTIAPSNHNGYSVPDLIYAQNSNDGTEVITFPAFGLGSTALTPSLTPNNYLSIVCSVAGTATSKFIQWPLELGVQNLVGVSATLVFWAQSTAGATNISISVLEFLGSGAVSPDPIIIQPITLTSSWVKYTIPFTFTNVTGSVIPGSPADDAWFLQINLPPAGNGTFTINIANPGLFIGVTADSVPTSYLETVDQVAAITNTPRTGDVRATVNSFQPFGWVPANDGTIGDASSNATTRAAVDTFPLFNQLWNIAKAYDSGSTSNPICQMYTSGGVAANFGSTAIGDYKAHNQLALTRQFGKVMLGTAPISSLLAAQKTTFTAINSGGLAIVAANNVNFFNGMPVVFTTTTGVLPTGIVANAVYYVANFGGTTTFNVATSFANAMAGTVISFTNTGTPPNNVISAVVGSSEGEYAHTQLVAELAAHSHTTSPNFGSTNAAAGAGVNAATAGAGNNTGTTGSSTPFNVTQPSTMLNIFFKL